MSGEWWSIMTVAGPVLLGAAMLWAVLHNRQTPSEHARTEQGTKDLREEIERDTQADHERHHPH